MPCTDGGVPYPPSRKEVLDDKAPAMLCAILETFALERDALVVINAIDEKAAGVTKAEIKEWWKEHRKTDAARKKREAAKKRDAKRVKAALAKLSVAERKALGLL